MTSEKISSRQSSPIVYPTNKSVCVCVCVFVLGRLSSQDTPTFFEKKLIDFESCGVKTKQNTHTINCILWTRVVIFSTDCNVLIYRHKQQQENNFITFNCFLIFLYQKKIIIIQEEEEKKPINPLPARNGIFFLLIFFRNHIYEL